MILNRNLQGLSLHTCWLLSFQALKNQHLQSILSLRVTTSISQFVFRVSSVCCCVQSERVQIKHSQWSGLKLKYKISIYCNQFQPFQEVSVDIADLITLFPDIDRWRFRCRLERSRKKHTGIIWYCCRRQNCDDLRRGRKEI